ncbi:hypothetical protein ACRRTK_021547 [Alexandromys fortis]
MVRRGKAAPRGPGRLRGSRSRAPASRGFPAAATAPVASASPERAAIYRSLFVFPPGWKTLKSESEDPLNEISQIAPACSSFSLLMNKQDLCPSFSPLRVSSITQGEILEAQIPGFHVHLNRTLMSVIAVLLGQKNNSCPDSEAHSSE